MMINVQWERKNGVTHKESNVYFLVFFLLKNMRYIGKLMVKTQKNINKKRE